MLLSRILSKPSSFRFITLISSSQSHYNHHHPPPLQNPTSSYFFSINTCNFSTDNGNNNKNNNGNGPKSSDSWSNWSENIHGNETESSLFSEDLNQKDEDPDPFGVMESEGKVEQINDWKFAGGVGKDEEGDHDPFRVIESEGKTEGMKDWKFAERDHEIMESEGKVEGMQSWKFAGEDDKDREGDHEIFDIGDVKVSELTGLDEDNKVETRNKEEDRLLEIEEKHLSEVLKGGDHAFGDLISASGITDEMLDSLMVLKDLDEVPGLPPLQVIEDMRYEKNTHKVTRAEIERKKQEEIAKARVRKVDTLGRAYGTGKRKCSIARVWIEPGEFNFVVNDKQFDAYFPMLDQRAALLRPFTETKTLGLFKVNCTVKGGGISGQVGAIRLGISRALQNWAPDEFRPPLKEAGFLTRDSRIVERKKPGKAKARKSFQWVKR